MIYSAVAAASAQEWVTDGGGKARMHNARRAHAAYRARQNNPKGWVTQRLKFRSHGRNSRVDMPKMAETILPTTGWGHGIRHLKGRETELQPVKHQPS